MDKGVAYLIMFLVLLAIIAFNTFLIMIIWNNIIIKKFPDSNIQKLNFLESFGLAIFVSILFGGFRTVFPIIKSD